LICGEKDGTKDPENSKFSLKKILNFRSHGNDIFMIQTVNTFNKSKKHDCPIFKWSGFHFDLVQELPCQNAVEVQKFTIDQQFYLAFANHMNDAGNTSIYSYIYKLDLNTEKFVLHQRLYTNAANDIRYFYFDSDYEREHFLIVGNSYERGKSLKNGER
jgi:hypothetical protein